jgi:glutamine amidotransferase
MGLCFSQPVAAAFSMREFALRDEANADGWGLSWYEGKSLTIVKEPLAWRQSGCAGFLSEYQELRSHLYIAHVRHATVGGVPKHADTHPFSRELNGEAYCFAHNGTVRSATETLLLDRFHPIGDTDSEHAFCYLLDALATRGGGLTSPDDWRWLTRQIAALNRMGKFNALISDGQRLFAWRDVNGFKGLSVHAVKIGGGRVEHLEDPTMDLALASDRESRGIIVATRPLNAKGWHALQHGELLVINAGRIEFSSTRSNFTTRARAKASAC